MADVRISGLHKRYSGGVHAVRGIDLQIPDRQFTVLVGPSGCGKSTLLRTIAGLEDADGGTIEIGGDLVNNVRPRDRDVAMVFQDYALYPHMRVEMNIGFGLRARKFPRSEIDARVKKAAAMLDITNLLQRYPRQLSGGQRQRVAIGRAIVRNPKLFLFDEPLSNLDAQLRDEMRSEIKRLHKEIATTMIYVTHDQIEAMTLADQIVLMRDGVIEQEGAPLDLFERPASRFVAGFLGSPKMNFLAGTLSRTSEGDSIRIDGDGTSVPLPPNRLGKDSADGRRLVVGLRPEHMMRAIRASPADGTIRYDALIELVQPTGSRTYATFRMGGEPVIAELQAHDVSRPGERIPIDVNLKRAAIFDAETEKAL
ncbi:MAG TPA: sn-glycerol-3-phosphate ABC transporter ATP-binding protein UgpC [Propylenella sp.]